MNLRDITDAVAADDRPAIQQAFRALVDYPHEEKITAASPDLLVVALNRVCAALATDKAVMPTGTCAALGLPPGAIYADGAATARRDRTRLSKALVERFAA